VQIVDRCSDHQLRFVDGQIAEAAANKPALPIEDLFGVAE
jgi:hypothetical protein